MSGFVRKSASPYFGRRPLWASVSDKDGSLTAGAKLYGVLVSTLSLGWVEGCWGDSETNVPEKTGERCPPPLAGLFYCFCGFCTAQTNPSYAWICFTLLVQRGFGSSGAPPRYSNTAPSAPRCRNRAALKYKSLHVLGWLQLHEEVAGFLGELGACVGVFAEDCAGFAG